MGMLYKNYNNFTKKKLTFMHLFRVIAYEHTKQKGRLLDSCCMFWRCATIFDEKHDQDLHNLSFD